MRRKLKKLISPITKEFNLLPHEDRRGEWYVILYKIKDSIPVEDTLKQFWKVTDLNANCRMKEEDYYIYLISRKGI